MAARRLGDRPTYLFGYAAPAAGALLIALAAVTLPAPGAEAARLARCDVWVRFDDTKTKGLTVRAAPDTEARPIAVLHPGSDTIHLRVSGALGIWLRVRAARLVASGTPLFGRTGWIPRAAAQVTTRGPAGGTVAAWWGPTTRTGRKGRFAANTALGVLSCWGTWVFVGDAKKAGWLAPRDRCPSGPEDCG